MADIATDLRAIKTEKAIIEAFHELSQELDFNKINVSVLAERANINRKTFYLHYHSIEDLIVRLQKDFIDQIKKHLGRNLDNGNMEKNFSETICLFAKEPHFFYKVLSYGDYSKIIDLARDPLRQSFRTEQRITPSKFPEFTYYYLVAAIRSIFCLWYEDGMRIPIEEIAEYGSNLVFHGIPLRNESKSSLTDAE